jgi:hypothetical protein
MPALDSADTHVSKRAPCASEAAIMISQDDAGQDRVWPRGRDPVEYACFHLFRYVLRVRLKGRPHHSAALGAASLTLLSQLLHRHCRSGLF